MYAGKGYTFIQYSKKSPTGVDQRVDLRKDGCEYIFEVLERDINENRTRH